MYCAAYRKYVIGFFAGLSVAIAPCGFAHAFQIDGRADAVTVVNTLSGGSTGEVSADLAPAAGANFGGSGLARWNLPQGVFGTAATGVSAGTDGGGAGIGSITYFEEITLLYPDFEGTAMVGLGATLDGSTGGAALAQFPTTGTAIAEVFLQIQGWPRGFPGLGSVDTFLFQGGVNQPALPDIEQTFHETLSILFPVFVTAGTGQFQIQIDFHATAGANGGTAFSDFANTALFDMDLPVGASIQSKSGFLSQAVPEGHSLLLLTLGLVALAAYRRRVSSGVR